MNLEEVLNYRRSVRAYDKDKTDGSGKSEALSGTGDIGSQQFEYAVVGVLSYYGARIVGGSFKSLSRPESGFDCFTNRCFRCTARLGTGSMLGSFSISNGRIFAGTVQKNVRINVSKTGNYTTGN